MDDKIVVCGRFAPNEDTPCFELARGSSQWSRTIDVPFKLKFFGSSVIDGKWLLTGGADEDLNIDDRVFLYYDGIFKDNESMDSYKMGHCQVTLNDTHVFVTGGRHSYATFILDVFQQVFTPLPSLPEEIEFGACGLLNNPANGPGDFSKFNS